MIRASQREGLRSAAGEGVLALGIAPARLPQRARRGRLAGHPMRPAAMMPRSTSLCRTRLLRYGPVFMPQCSFRVLFREVLHGKRSDRGDDGHAQKHA